MLNPNYITAIELEEYFVNKFSGEPLSGGWLYFFEDLQRTTPKNVFTLTGGPPNYTYTSEGAALQLSGAGTVVDNAGNPIKIYYYPFDAFGNPQLYYVVCTDANGVQQFVRQAQPNPNGPISGVVNAMGNENMLSNPQFAQINTIPSGQVLNFVGAGTTVFQIAPDWNLNVTSTGSGTVTVTRNSIAGSAALPSNPPYTLTITPGANISGMNLTQTLPNNPDIFSPSVAGAQNGFVNASVLLANNSSVNINYVTSNTSGSAPISQQILTFNNNTGVYAESNATIQLVPAANPDNGSIGYVQFQVVLNNLVTPTELSNLQLIGLSSNITNVAYQQTTVNRQIDHLFNYYEPLLNFKPITNFLLGWDFSANPQQFFGYYTNLAANINNYITDQTILWQNVANYISGASFTNQSALQITSNNNACQFALVTYIPTNVAREILLSDASFNVSARSSVPVNASIALYYTTGGSLPSVAAGHSIVSTLDANGNVTAFNGTWTLVPRRNNLGPCNFTITNNSNTLFNDYSFNTIGTGTGVAASAVTFAAVVLGIGNLPNAATVTVDSICLVPGNIPTRPAPDTFADTLKGCQRFWESSFDIGTLNGIVYPSLGNGDFRNFQIVTNSTATLFSTIRYSIVKYGTTPTITLINPNDGTQGATGIWNITASQNWSLCSVQVTAESGFTVIGTTSGGSAVNNISTLHWISDSRLGA